MKMGNYLRALSVFLLLGIQPLVISAKTKSACESQTLDNLSCYNLIIPVDSIPKSKRQDDKDVKKKPEKEPKHEPKTVEIDTKRPNIKEVPKSRPKLRPGVVTDRVKIKRPPVRGPGRIH